MTPQLPHPKLSWAALFGIALAYVLLGRAALLLSIPPGYATPLYPSAGLALAAVLTWGPRALVPIFIGACSVSMWGGAMKHPLGWSDLQLDLVLGAAATAQAWAGAWLIKRFVPQPLTLSEPRDIALFFIIGAFATCIVGSSLSCTALAWTGRVASENLGFTWLTWWVGDSMGTLVAAPVALTLFGRPQDAWVHRRVNVGVTLVLATVFVAAMVTLVAHWNEERSSSQFEREAATAASEFAGQLTEPLRALEAMRSLYLAHGEPNREEFRKATRAWVGTPDSGTFALAWVARVAPDDVAAFEARMRSGGVPDYRVFDRKDLAPASPDDMLLGSDVLPIALIEPAHTNAALLGSNIHAISAARVAVARSVLNDSAAATEAFSAPQQGGTSRRLSMIVYRAMYDGTPANGPQRLQRYKGLFAVGIDLEQSMNAIVDHVPKYLNACLVDSSPPALPRRLFGRAGCETRHGARLHVQPLTYAGRKLELRVTSEFGALTRASGLEAWLFSLIGLMAASVLGALLLAVTGRTRRIAVAVRERTAALEQEVREREDAESALRLSEQRFRNVFETMPLGLLYASIDGVIHQANPRICEMTGYRREELIGRHAELLVDPRDIADGRTLTRRLLQGDFPSYVRQARFRHASGREIGVRTVVSALRDETGRLRDLVTVVEDITESLRLEDAERAREAAEASNRAKSEFLSRMSHELRTPLNAMLGFAQLLEMDVRHGINDTQRAWVAQIQQAGWHLLEMINDILDLSRIEAGTLRLVFDTLEVPALLSATLPLVEGSVRERSLTIQSELDPAAGLIRGDSTRVKQVLTNLLSNAVKYNRDGGRVRIVTRRVGDDVEIAVHDTGLGMTPAQLDQLFTPFNRLGRERSAIEGTGIGLVISQRLAQLMQGSLTAQSVSGEGSSFVLRLPSVDEADTVPSQLDDLHTATPAYHRRLVHYVEDNETNVEVMRGIIAQRPQVRMDVSLNGRDGIDAIQATLPDVVLLDMHLPDVNGLDMLKHLKSLPTTAHIPVIVVSADAVESQIDAAMAAGAEHYLTKPVSVSELLTVLDELLERATTRFG